MIARCDIRCRFDRPIAARVIHRRERIPCFSRERVPVEKRGRVTQVLLRGVEKLVPSRARAIERRVRECSTVDN